MDKGGGAGFILFPFFISLLSLFSYSRVSRFPVATEERWNLSKGAKHSGEMGRSPEWDWSVTKMP